MKQNTYVPITLKRYDTRFHAVNHNEAIDRSSSIDLWVELSSLSGLCQRRDDEIVTSTHLSTERMNIQKKDN